MMQNGFNKLFKNVICHSFESMTAKDILNWLSSAKTLRNRHKFEAYRAIFTRDSAEACAAQQEILSKWSLHPEALLEDPNSWLKLLNDYCSRPSQSLEGMMLGLCGMAHIYGSQLDTPNLTKILQRMTLFRVALPWMYSVLMANLTQKLPLESELQRDFYNKAIQWCANFDEEKTLSTNYTFQGAGRCMSPEMRKAYIREFAYSPKPSPSHFESFKYFASALSCQEATALLSHLEKNFTNHSVYADSSYHVVRVQVELLTAIRKEEAGRKFVTEWIDKSIQQLQFADEEIKAAEKETKDVRAPGIASDKKLHNLQILNFLVPFFSPMQKQKFAATCQDSKNRMVIYYYLFQMEWMAVLLPNSRDTLIWILNKLNDLVFLGPDVIYDIRNNVYQKSQVVIQALRALFRCKDIQPEVLAFFRRTWSDEVPVRYLNRRGDEIENPQPYQKKCLLIQAAWDWLEACDLKLAWDELMGVDSHNVIVHPFMLAALRLLAQKASTEQVRSNYGLLMQKPFRAVHHGQLVAITKHIPADEILTELLTKYTSDNFNNRKQIAGFCRLLRDLHPSNVGIGERAQMFLLDLLDKQNDGEKAEVFAAIENICLALRNFIKQDNFPIRTFCQRMPNIFRGSCIEEGYAYSLLQVLLDAHHTKMQFVDIEKWFGENFVKDLIIHGVYGDHYSYILNALERAIRYFPSNFNATNLLPIYEVLISMLSMREVSLVGYESSLVFLLYRINQIDPKVFSVAENPDIARISVAIHSNNSAPTSEGASEQKPTTMNKF